MVKAFKTGIGWGLLSMALVFATGQSIEQNAQENYVQARNSSQLVKGFKPERGEIILVKVYDGTEGNEQDLIETLAVSQNGELTLDEAAQLIQTGKMQMVNWETWGI